jgi:hypothetical protein
VACHHDWTTYLTSPADTLISKLSQGTLSGPGLIQNVPLYHDCQRFLVGPADNLAFDSLFAVFATQRVKDLATIAAGDAIPAAEILAWNNYDPLSINAGYNCIYMGKSAFGEWVATIVNYGKAEGDCQKTRPASELLGTVLQVIPRAPPMATIDSDFPHVARWDWDRTNSQHYLGLPCGLAWCEIGRPGFVPSPSAFDELPVDYTDTLSNDQKKRLAIKGWYDQQIIAAPPLTAGTRARSSGIMGTVIPLPHEGDPDEGFFTDQWKPVVYVLLNVPEGVNNPYDTKLNLEATTAGGQVHNTISLCYAGSSACGLSSGTPSCSAAYQAASSMGVARRWWAKIESSDGDVEYKCVLAYPPPMALGNAGTPRTARWHWLDRDEVMWEWCPTGCCEQWSD